MAATRSGTHTSEGESLPWIALALAVLAPAAYAAEIVAMARGWDPNQLAPLLILGPAAINIAAAATAHYARLIAHPGARGRWMTTVALALAYLLFAMLLAAGFLVVIVISQGLGD